MPRASFTVDATGFSRSLAQYATLIQNGQPRADIVRNQMKFAVRALIDLTPFETLAQGRAIVRRDLMAAMKPYGGEDGLFSKIQDDGLRGRLVAYLRAGEYGKIKDIWSKIGRNSGFRMVDFDPLLHTQNMDSRARPRGDQKILVPQVQEWKEYLDKLRGQVGRARGGWAESAAAFGLTLPAWITRHKGGGDVEALIEKTSVTFTLINRGVFMPRYEERVRLALAGREKAMATDLRRWLAGQATYAGFGP